jgi:hypothetical protein
MRRRSIFLILALAGIFWAGSSAFGGMPEAIAAGADLVVASIGNPPAYMAAGATFSVNETTKNQGTDLASASVTRYYLSESAAKDKNSLLLTGTRSVPPLKPGASSKKTVKVTIPPGTSLGAYYVIACADDTGVVEEVSDINNCAASTATMHVSAPDLIETFVTDPPASVSAGGSFSVTDTAKNAGEVAAGASTTRYYLSTSTSRKQSAILLNGRRSVSALKAGASSTKKATVTIPSGTAPGAYYLLACTDDLAQVAESDEENNCVASSTQVTVPVYALADLIGSWGLNSLATGPGAPWWSKAAVTIKADGTFAASETDSEGERSTIKSKFLISKDGLITIEDDPDGFQCRLDAGGTVIVCTGTWAGPGSDAGTTEMKVLTKKAASCTLADLAGLWDLNALASGPGEPWWERATLTINADGTVAFSGVQSDGEPDVFNFTMRISSDGVITADEIDTLLCKLDSGKSVFACTSTWKGDGTADMSLGTKRAPSYSSADLVGTWDTNTLVSGPKAPYWERGFVTIDSNGDVLGSTTDSHGSWDSVGGTLSITLDGLITKDDKPGLQCRLDADKTVAVCTRTRGGGSTEMSILTKAREPAL